jgi:MbtH protein
MTSSADETPTLATGGGASAVAADDRLIVVVNHEEQYAIWPASKPVPTGWRSVGISGTGAECLAYVRRVWVDMRPLSVRARHNALGLE